MQEVNHQIYKPKSLRNKKRLILGLVIASITFYSLFFHRKELIIVYDSLFAKGYYKKYNIDAAISSYSKKIERHRMVDDLYLVKKFQHDTVNILAPNDEKLSLAELGYFFEMAKHHIRPTLRTTRLHIDKEIKMRSVNELKQELRGIGMLKLAYVIQTDTPLRKMGDRILIHKLMPLHLIKEEYFEKVANYHSFISIEQLENGEYIVAGKRMNTKELRAILKEEVNTGKLCALNFYINDKANFQSFINVYSAYGETIDEWQEQQAQEKYKKSYIDLSIDNKRALRQERPFFFTEITEALQAKSRLKL